MAELITPILQALLDCVCQRLVTEGRPVCECCIVVSDTTPEAVSCDCNGDTCQGRAWGRLVRPEWQQSDIQRCPIGVWDIDYEVGIYRCAPIDPGCSTQTANAMLAHQDLASLARALTCCPALGDFTPKLRWEIGRGSILGPQGGCMGVTMTITVQTPRLHIP